MDFKGVNLVRSYEDFMPHCKFQKEEQYDTYRITLRGFKTEQFKVNVDEKNGTIKIKGERPADGSTWSRFRQEFKVPSDVYNTKDITARFGNGVLSITLPKKEPSNDTSDPFVNRSLLCRLKMSKRAILRTAIAVVAGVAVGAYVTFKCLPTHVIKN